MFIAVQHLDQVGLVVPPDDVQVAGVEQVAQLVAHQFDDGLECQLRRDALLDAVDERQFVGALQERALALGQLMLEALAETEIGQDPGGLACQCGQQVAVFAVEATQRAFGVGIEVAQQFPPRDQRRDQA